MWLQASYCTLTGQSKEKNPFEEEVTHALLDRWNLESSFLHPMAITESHHKNFHFWWGKIPIRRFYRPFECLGNSFCSDQDDENEDSSCLPTSGGPAISDELLPICQDLGIEQPLIQELADLDYDERQNVEAPLPNSGTNLSRLPKSYHAWKVSVSATRAALLSQMTQHSATMETTAKRKFSSNQSQREVPWKESYFESLKQLKNGERVEEKPGHRKSFVFDRAFHWFNRFVRNAEPMPNLDTRQLPLCLSKHAVQNLKGRDGYQTNNMQVDVLVRLMEKRISQCRHPSRVTDETASESINEEVLNIGGSSDPDTKSTVKESSNSGAGSSTMETGMYDMGRHESIVIQVFEPIYGFKLDIGDRIESTARRQAFISIKDHKENFQNNPKCRLLNPAKNNLGLISKQILDRVNNSIRSQTNANQWRNTHSVIDWFSGIEDKSRHSFLIFDIVDFYTSISEALLKLLLNYARQFTTVSDEDVEIIMHSRKTLLFNNNEPWVKKGDSPMLDVVMGSYDGAEVCELVGLYILHKLTSTYPSGNIGLNRDDDLAEFKNMSARSLDKARKDF
ncbi:hypothetical protein ACROYT_G015138 [Oculina patagonica]